MSAAAYPLPRRRWPGPAVAQNVDFLAALALACLYFAVMSGHLHSIDGLVMYRQALSIAYDHSLHFATPVWWGVSAMTSKFGLGLSLLYLPGLFIWSWLLPYVPIQHGQSYDYALLYADPLYTVAAAPVHILVTAVSAYLVARFIRELGFGSGIALLGLLLYGIASPAIVYARGDWAQPLEGLCWIGALYAAFRFRRMAGRRALFACGLAVCYAVMTRLVEGSLVLPAVLLVTLPHVRFRQWPRSSWRAVEIVTASYAAGIFVTLLVNWGRYGSALTTGYEGWSWNFPLALGVVGALVSPGRGLLWEFPVVLLVPLGLRALWGTEHRLTGLVLAGLPLAQLLNVASWGGGWWGAWSWGLRLFVPALPLIAILAAIGVIALPAALRQWLPGVLLVAGVTWAVPCIVTDLLGGYAGTYNGTVESFQLRAYPPFGAWNFFHHWRAQTAIDSGAADILWWRLARYTGNASLLPPLLLGVTAAALAFRVLVLQASPGRLQAGAEAHPAGRPVEERVGGR